MVDVTRGPGGEAGEEAPPLAQLRRRYDELRADYESLLDRLHDLESRAGPASAATTPTFGLVDGLFAPLEQLRAEYQDALRSLQGVVEGLGAVLGARLKGQRPGPAATGDAPPSDDRPIRIDVRGRGAPSLLAFRDRLAALPGVAAVNIHAVDQEAATLVVELETSP